MFKFFGVFLKPKFCSFFYYNNSQCILKHCMWKDGKTKKKVILVSFHVTSKYWMEDRGYFPNLKKIKCYK